MVFLVSEVSPEVIFGLPLLKKFPSVSGKVVIEVRSAVAGVLESCLHASRRSTYSLQDDSRSKTDE